MKTHFVLGAIFTSLIAMSCSNQESLDGMLTESQSLSAPHRYGIPCNSNVITKDDAAFVADKLAGCTVVAAGQLMNYFQYPQSYDWNAIASNNYNNEAIALLSKDIQNKFKVKYGTNGTSSTISNVKEGLEDFGYSVKESEELYSFRLIEKYHQPLYEQGINEAGIGHAWVVDGYETFDYQYYYIVEYLRGSAGNYYYERDNTTYSADDGNLVVPTLTHYNWGWGGAEDGFYQEPKYKKNVKQLNLSK